MTFISDFEEAVARYAEDADAGAVLCGHIHMPSIRKIGKVSYYNCGDWVEHCTALVENRDGKVEMLRLRESAAADAASSAV